MYSNGYRSSAAPAGVAYTVVAWLVAQVLQLVFESFGTPDWVMKTVLVLPALGRKAEAKQRLAEFIEQNQSWAAFPISGYYTFFGDKDSAFEWLEAAYQQHSGLLSGILLNPRMKSLHDDPRWRDLLERLNLPL